MMKNLEARLQYLEAREEANTRDVVRLKTENVDLQTKMCDLQRKNTKVTEKLVQLETLLVKMETDLETVFGFRQDIVGRLSTLESNVPHVKDTEDRVSKLESTMNEIRQDVASSSQSVLAKLDDMTSENKVLQSVVDLRLGEMESSLDGVRRKLEHLKQDMSCQRNNNEARNQGVSTSQKKFDGRLRSLESSSLESKRVCQSLTDKLKFMDRQTRAALYSVESLTKTQDAISKCMNSVVLTSKKTLEEGVCTRLDCNDSTHSGCLEPSVDGKYFVTIFFIQSEIGTIQMFLNDSEVTQFIGQTTENSGTSCVSRVMELKKGDKLWLETKKLKGKAYIHWCELLYFCISPLRIY